MKNVWCAKAVGVTTPFPPPFLEELLYLWPLSKMSPKARTDLRKGVSRAKFDEEADGEVRLAVAPQKPCQNNEKL